MLYMINKGSIQDMCEVMLKEEAEDLEPQMVSYME